MSRPVHGWSKSREGEEGFLANKPKTKLWLSWFFVFGYALFGINLSSFILRYFFHDASDFDVAFASIIITLLAPLATLFIIVVFFAFLEEVRAVINEWRR